MNLIGALALLLSTHAHAIPETDYPARYDSQVVPFYKKGISGELTGADGAALSYRKFEVRDPALEAGALVILPGYGESYVKYAELIHDLEIATRGAWSIYIYDHRGMGFSSRLAANPKIGHVASFDHYVDDLETFTMKIVKARPHRRTVLLGHSMGGAIATLYAQRHPDDYQALVLSAPMLEINTSPYPKLVARALSAANCALGHGLDYAPGQHDPRPGRDRFEGNRTTHSEARFREREALNAEHPGIVLGGVSNRWISQALAAAARARKGAALVKVPVLLLQATEDAKVLPDAQNEFCRRAPQCTKLVVRGARHNVLVESDAIRTPLVAEVARFLTEHAGSVRSHSDDGSARPLSSR